MQVNSSLDIPTRTSSIPKIPSDNLLCSSSPSIIIFKFHINPFKSNATITTSSPSFTNLNPLSKTPLPPPPSLSRPPRPNDYPTLNLLQRLAAAALDKIENSLIESPVRAGLEVIGEIPPSLNGVYRRNGANPLLPPSGGHHLFDGDGMIHSVRLGPGKDQAAYCCRFTQTNWLVQEKAMGRPLFPKPVGELHGRTGLARLCLFYARAGVGLVDPVRGIGVANAGLVYCNEKLLAMSEDDLPYHVKINGDDGELETIGRFDFAGQTREVPVELPQPTMIHDFAMTKNFVVVPDSQVVFKLSEMVLGRSPLRFDPDKTARFGVLPKQDRDQSRIKWIEVHDSFCFHFMNAWEEIEPRARPGPGPSNVGKTIVVIGSCMSPPDSMFNEGSDSIQIDLCEIRLDLKTGKSSKRVIVPGMNLEVGQVNKWKLGHTTKYTYMAIAEPWPKCAGIAKVDLETGDVERFIYGHERYGGETCLVPAIAIGDDGEEDEGWILSLVRDEGSESSELVILRAKDMKQIACACMPSRVPYGFHGTFVSQYELAIQSDTTKS
ncbi:hypothetical protein Cgig2_011065 [Carnegiea gigantea]|uniref:9-cis-epoxycarotenoid dioxygenase n=1 Tax=Carnegiea gigantea TaxID=171969 RepID=A0A9Q1Q5H8_9CARY|nr:hypothetical protein Cgig2_011065 [Carnegiea gigantea]